MTRRRTRLRTLASALAASGLLAGALLASGTAAAAPSYPAGAALASASKANNGPPAGAPVTSPAPGQVFAPGSSIKLSAAPLLVSDAVKDGLSSAPVTAIKFFASTSLTSNVLVGEAKSAPWTVSWNHVPAGDYSVTAVTDNKQGSTTSDPVAIRVVKPSVLTAQSSLTIAKGHSASFAVKLSTAPSSPVTVHLSDAGTGTKVSKGQALTFTPSNWNQPQPVTVAAAQTKAGSHSTITASAAGLGSASVAVTAAPTATGYDQWFLNLYNQLTNSSNGYFSPKGIPYHSVEQLIVEAPDYGHETTSETFSYWLWLTADFGRVSGDWTAFNNAWSVTMQYDVPNAANQPGCSAYNASSPATYGPEAASPASYPVALNSSVPVGSDPLSAELTSTYGGCTLDTPMWIMDTDNRYGFGQQEDGTSTPSYVNTFQRGSEESVWDTVDQPDWDNLSKGESGSGYLAPVQQRRRQLRLPVQVHRRAGRRRAHDPGRVLGPAVRHRAGQPVADLVDPGRARPSSATTCGTRCTTSTSSRSAPRAARTARWPARPARPRPTRKPTCCPGTTPGAAPPPAPGPGGSAAPRSTRATRTRWRRTRCPPPRA